MEDNFTHHDFEEFLQKQVRNHRMYPKDAVWRNINKKLHGDKKWPGLTIAAMAVLSATVAVCVYFTPQANIFSIKPAITPSVYANSSSVKDNSLNKLTSTAPFAETNSNTAVNTDQAPAVKSADVFKGSTPYYGRVSNNNTARTSPVNFAVSKAHTTEVGVVVSDESSKVLSSLEPELLRSSEAASLSTNNKVTVTTPPSKTSENLLAVGKDYNDKNIVDNFLNEHKEVIPLHTTAKVNSIKHKFSYQIYIAPSISYRKLFEDPLLTKGGNTGPVALNYVTDVNNVVRHKPGAGLEAGVSFMYNLSSRFRLKTGLQFNVRQYSIEAYRANTEVASITLIGTNGPDTVNTYAFYRNNNGYSSTELVNRYYQLAVPMGVEWEIVGNKKIKLNVAGSIQPTYLLNRNAYLLTTNFKNYTESPDMIRSWNINSNIEAFISVNAGEFKWQFGPQLRYQPYSTFIAEYPIKEHLLDYGLKIGVSKVIR